LPPNHNEKSPEPISKPPLRNEIQYVNVPNFLRTSAKQAPQKMQSEYASLSDIYSDKNKPAPNPDVKFDKNRSFDDYARLSDVKIEKNKSSDEYVGFNEVNLEKKL